MTFNPDLALSFLSSSRSRFLQHAADWLDDFNDPVDVLFMLSQQTGQALGPWETARFCALLGLTPSAPVQEHLQDVLVEPVDGETSPPVAAAMALAHAKDVFVDADTPYAQDLVVALDAGRDKPNVAPCVVDAALLALCHARGALPHDDIEAAALRSLPGYLQQHPAYATTVLEAAVLANAVDLQAAALDVLGQEQTDAGAICGEERHPIRQGFITLRAVALVKRLQAQRSQSPADET